jgi:serine/threonine protein kinase
VSLIADRYQPLDSGRTGGGVRARDLQTAQTVILRDVPLPLDRAEQMIAHARAAKGIFHPSLVTLFEVLREQERLLLAYEYVPAQSAAQVSAGHPVNPRRAAQIVSELADAVAELHARGVVHGGIDQTSVLITLKGKAKLDRTGDPALRIGLDAQPGADLAALGELLAELAGAGDSAASGPVTAIVRRIRSGRIETAAALAATLRAV